MSIAQAIILILTELPDMVAVIDKWQAAGTVPTQEQVQAELDGLGVDDAALDAAYRRAFPGQEPPK